MRSAKLWVAVCSAFLIITSSSNAQDRVRFNEQDIWVNGSNVAWINFARDIGPGTTNLPVFREMFRELHQAGGNSMRLWLHTTGATTPEFSGNTVVGPGNGAIEDLRDILDAAWEQEIGLMLTLWGHDMLRTDINSSWTTRNQHLLTNSQALDAYIQNALIPMVEGVKDHPAILAWEVFNEPEGISVEYGWSDRVQVPMADIQRVTNRIAGAIHRADPGVHVTTGTHGMYANSDVTLGKTSNSAIGAYPDLTPRLRQFLNGKYGPLSDALMIERLRSGSGSSSFNYYSDDRLVAAGGDVDGTLDFYTIHYYDWAQTAASPFHHDYSEWQLDKPMVIAEFFMEDTFGVDWEDLYQTLYDRGYAGAMSWQWYDTWARGNDSWPRTLSNTATMAAYAPDAVDIVSPGPDIHFFTADKTQIESGGTATLSWRVTNAETILLNGTTVDSESSLTVSPGQSTTYVLETSGEGIVRSDSVTIAVLSAAELNRALNQPALASSSESGANSDPSRAFDGDTASRWSSEYADNQWLQVDLGKRIDIQRVELRWEVAFGREYDIQLSNDGIVWTTVFEERNGDGGIDSIEFVAPEPGRFVRLVAISRGTMWGFSLWEMGIYGLVSADQPPTVSVVSPAAGDSFQAGEEVTIQVAAQDENDDLNRVEIALNEETVAVLTDEPFEFQWTAPSEGGEFNLVAVATDDAGLKVQSQPVAFVVLGTSLITRYEFESTDLSGGFELRTDGSFSGTPFVLTSGSTTATLASVPALQEGSHDLGVRYRLVDQPVAAQLRVNALPVGFFSFEGSAGQWRIVSRPVQFRLGDNRIDFLLPAGVEIDYIEIAPPGLAVHTEPHSRLVSDENLELFPNPASKYLNLQWKQEARDFVTVSLFDIRGKQIAVLFEGYSLGVASAHLLTLPDLPSGVYFVNVNSTQRNETQKLIVLQ